MANDPMRLEVRDEQAEQTLNEIGKRLREAMPPGYGFSLMVFSYGPNGNMFYTSSAKRADMIRAMREFIAKFEEN